MASDAAEILAGVKSQYPFAEPNNAVKISSENLAFAPLTVQKRKE